MKTKVEMLTRLEEVSKQMGDIMSTLGEIPTDEQQMDINKLETESKALKASIEMATKAEEASNRLEEAKQLKVPRLAPDTTHDMEEHVTKLPASVRKWGKLKCFTDSAKYTSDVKAYRFGQYLRATLGSDKARNWCLMNGVEIRGAMLEDNNSKGGYLVPGEFSSDIIRLVEERGVFRRNARVVPMTQDKLDIPKYSAGSTAYFVGEAKAITASDLTYELVTLIAKKLGAIVPVSGELSDDAVVNVADLVAEDIAYKFADKEDECGFNGTGSGTYGGIVGLRQQLIEKVLAGDGTSAVPAGSGLVRYGTGHSYANIAIATLTQLIGKLPVYAERNAKWYMSKVVWSYCLDLLADAGGNTIPTLMQGGGPQLFGYPVQFVDVMPKASAVNQVCVLFGDLRLAATFGDRRSMAMAMSNSAYVGSTSMFETDQVAIRGIERFDIVTHDVGSTTATGPIVGIISHTA